MTVCHLDTTVVCYDSSYLDITVVCNESMLLDSITI